MTTGQRRCTTRECDRLPSNEATMATSQPNRNLLGLLLFALLLGLLGAGGIVYWRTVTPTVPRPTVTEKPRDPVWHQVLQARIRDHLEACSHECLRTADKRIEELRKVFNSYRANR